MKTTITTGSTNAAVLPRPELRVTEDTRNWIHVFSPALWDGAHVWVHKTTARWDDPMFRATHLETDAPICASYEHDLSAMMHHNPNGPDWGTGFLECSKCFGVAHDPGGFGDAA